MARFESYAPGQFSWVDLLTPNLAESQQFYESLFGWTSDATQDDTGNAYTMLKLGDLDVAGMGVMSEEMASKGVPAHWTSYVAVTDVAKSLARAVELGASVQLPAMDIRSSGELIGRMAVFVDPQGAALSLWEAGRHAGAGVANEPGSFCWNELCARDVAGAAAFYEQLFGWRIHPGDSDNGYREISVGDRLNGGILPWVEEMGNIPTSWSVYFAVGDCDAAVERMQELGGRLLVPARTIETGRFAVVADPHGAVFQMVALNNPDD